MDLPQHLVVTGLELDRVLAGVHGEHQHAELIEVALLGGVTARQDLGRHDPVVNHRGPDRVLPVHLLSDPEIADLAGQLVALNEQDVPGVHVVVHQLVVGQVLHGKQELPHQIDDQAIGEGGADHVLQGVVAALEHQVEQTAGLEEVEDVDDVRVAQPVQALGLPQPLVPNLLVGAVRGLEDLEGKLLIEGAHALEHGPEGAVPDQVPEQVAETPGRAHHPPGHGERQRAAQVLRHGITEYFTTLLASEPRIS